eukprot:scaffold76806_cov35-Tisochrysis_lutea.AAC.1
MNLKGKTPREVQAGARICVTYEEEQDDGTMLRVVYAGRCTQYSRADGVRVWFDGYTAEEQEWINDSDEWDWEDVVLAALKGPFKAVHIRLRGVRQALPRNAPVNGGFSKATRSGLSNPSADRSPHRFNKKARLLQAGGGGSSSSTRPGASKGTLQLPQPVEYQHSSDALRVGTAGKHGSGRHAKPLGKLGSQGALSAPPSLTPNGSTPHRNYEERRALEGDDGEPMVRVSMTVSGVALHMPSAYAAKMAGITPRVAPPPPPSEVDKYGLCKHSGVLARYCDPLTGERYGTIEALRKLREAAQAKPAATAVKAENGAAADCVKVQELAKAGGNAMSSSALIAAGS